jgi:enamine deaminase RidA (YjgF/YER057c/UK114 family)
MTIKGYINAVCRKCGKEIACYMKDQPFVDSIILGTCDDCHLKEVKL